MPRAKVVVPNWNPHLTYVWTTAQMQAWVDEYGSWCYYQGTPYEIKYKRVVPGRYEIKFVEKENWK